MLNLKETRLKNFYERIPPLKKLFYRFKIVQILISKNLELTIHQPQALPYSH
jgi:hypothetical protein